MWIILGFLAAGMVLGYAYRRHTSLITTADKAMTWAVYLLLFLLGVSVGANDTVMSQLGQLGWQAAWLTVGSVAGSVFVAALVYRFFFQSLAYEK